MAENQKDKKSCHDSKEMQGNGGPHDLELGSRGRVLEIKHIHQEVCCPSDNENHNSPPASPLPPPIFLYPGARKQKQPSKSPPSSSFGETAAHSLQGCTPPSSIQNASQIGFSDPPSPTSGGLSPSSSLQLMMMMMSYSGVGGVGSNGNDKVPKNPNYLMANERMNLMNMAKLSIKGLIESALNLGRTLDSDYAPLQQFFVVMEHCLKHGLKAKKTFLGQNKSFWGPLELVEKLVPEASEITASVKDLPGLKTPVGRGRAWLRLALMQKKLSEYMKALINRKDLLNEFYEPNALMMEEEGAIISGLLVGLNVIDANFCMKGEDLDSQVGVIDFSMYLKEGPIAKCNEGQSLTTPKVRVKSAGLKLERPVASGVHPLKRVGGSVSGTGVRGTDRKAERLTWELAVANNRIITMQEEMERMKDSYYMEANKANKQERSAEVQALSEARKHLKEETQLRLDIEKELEVQIGLRQEMEMAMKMLDKDVCDKQDALAALRQQLDDLRALKHELSFKLQSSDLAAKQKSELNSRLEEKTNQMAATIKLLEQRLRVAERDRQSAEEANRLFKQEFGDKIESLQLEVDQLRKQRCHYEMELKKERNRRSSGHRKLFSDSKNVANQHSPVKSPVKMVVEPQVVEPNVRPQNAVHDKSDCQTNNSPSLSIKSEDEDTDLQRQIGQMCLLCKEESSKVLTKIDCNHCGGVYCSACSANELPLPSSINPVQVCNSCHKTLMAQYSNSPS
ncbi:RUFY3 isoform X2 [Pelobates cultripes]|uniref:RUFY3 isoform X2 n=1 Tax=Pelobates cultripes TaxID=61616 RepID=A0AAD1SJJ7_PELCU|nr:RUFY3 isoform X2 [Pelobates cultripes]